ncbi:hypothetical protein [Mesorhizobium sp. M0293]|uniref:hypothetical protein n=1 Tax=Mesorhizobium sp. M0293 TaxID=2956930 RepID=UPI003337AF95
MDLRQRQPVGDLYLRRGTRVRSNLCRGLIEADHVFPASGSPDMIGGHIVSHAVDLGPQQAASVERLQAAPDLKMDVLHKVLLLGGIGFMSCRQPRQRAASISTVSA